MSRAAAAVRNDEMEQLLLQCTDTKPAIPAADSVVEIGFLLLLLTPLYRLIRTMKRLSYELIMSILDDDDE